MKRIIFVLAIIALFGLQAFADTTTLSFSGTIFNIADNLGLFGTAGHNYSSGSYTGTLSWNPANLPLAGPACTGSPFTDCSWALSTTNTVTETFTFTGNNNSSTTLSFTVTGGTLNFHSGGGTNQIQLSNGTGTGFNLNVQFGDGSNFFGNPPNLNPALNFGNPTPITLSFGTGNTNDGTGTQTSMGFNVQKLSATTTVVPEPCSMALLGSGLVGFGLRKLRGRRSA